MRQARAFARKHFMAGATVALLLATIIYHTLSVTAPVVERTRIAGTVVAITHTGTNISGRPPKLGYKIAPSDGGEPISLKDAHLYRIGDLVNVEKTVRRSGHTTYRVVRAPIEPLR